jgi:formylglycine-generating enzyme required for sulfatase activity
MADIFISYSKRERVLTVELARDLEELGYSVWWDTALVAGQVFRQEIRDQIQAARAVIVIWTPHSVKSDWVYAEAQEARRLGKLCPVRVEGLAPHEIPFPFSVIETVLLHERDKIYAALTSKGAVPAAPKRAPGLSPSHDHDVAVELAHWDFIKGSADSGEFRDFLVDFPEGRFAKLARKALEKLEWARIGGGHDPALFAAFVEEFPDGAYAAEAALRNKALIEEAERRAREENELQAGRIIRVMLGAGKGDRAQLIKQGSGESFKDIDVGPEMVVVPAGEFMMGSPDDEPERQSRESPRHKVIIPRPFAVGRFALTFDEWDAAVADGGCGGHKPADQGWGRGRRPVINVNWDDAQAYVKWLRQKTGKEYRLLSEAEWEYAARAGTTTPFWWGESISPDQANYDGNYAYAGGGQKGEYRQKTVPVDSFKANPWGLHQVHGNVWEGVEDCWDDNYNGAPADGSAWRAGDCSSHVLRGGSWFSGPGRLRSAARYRSVIRDDIFGFRVARTLTS